MLNLSNIGSRIFITVGLFVIAGICIVRAPARAADSFNYFATLQEKLVVDGFDKDTIRQIYSRPEVTFETKGISLYFVH